MEPAPGQREVEGRGGAFTAPHTLASVAFSDCFKVRCLSDRELVAVWIGFCSRSVSLPRLPMPQAPPTARAAEKPGGAKPTLSGLQKFGSMSSIHKGVVDRGSRVTVPPFILGGRDSINSAIRSQGWKVKLNELINDPKSNRIGAIIYAVLMGLVLLSSIVLCLGTLPEFQNNDEINLIEWACAIAFSIELILRIVSWQGPWYTMLVSGTLYVDLLSVVPFFLVQGIEMSQASVDIASEEPVEPDNGMQIIGILRSAPVET